VDPEPVLQRQAWSLIIDEACRTIQAHLERAGHAFIMLKGATIASWIYPEPARRTYLDLDILVSPDSEEQIVDCLREIGYFPLLDAGTLRPFSANEQPLSGPRGVMIDLHVALQGVRLEPADAWKTLSRDAVEWQWSGTRVRALAPPARAMHLALHVAQRGLVDQQAVRDLQLGLERLDGALWEEAGRVAARLHAVEAFTAGLQLLPEGSALVRRLRLDPTRDLETQMLAASVPHSAVAIERFISARGWRQRLILVRAKLLPSAQWLRFFHPESTSTPLGLLRTRLRVPAQVILRIPSALAERRRYKKDQNKAAEGRSYIGLLAANPPARAPRDQQAVRHDKGQPNEPHRDTSRSSGTAIDPLPGNAQTAARPGMSDSQPFRQ
jgi:hypothetical protein